jgi:hypothetical protein
LEWFSSLQLSKGKVAEDLKTEVYILEFDGKHTGIQITTSGSEESQHLGMHKHPSLLKF